MKKQSSGKTLLAKSKKLQDEASELLTSSGLLPLLRTCGEIEFVGSYRLGLMTHGDIDIHITRRKMFTKAEALKILTRIIAKTFFTSYFFGDWYKSGKDPNFPHGYYIGLKKMHCDRKWKIDLWFMSEEEQHRRDQERINVRNVKLTSTQKISMMRFKRYLNKIGITMWGQKVYEAVLLDDVTTIAEFKKWLGKRMKK